MHPGHENKMMKPQYIKLKLNTSLRGLTSGTVQRVRVDKHKTPLERYWRDRLKDAKIDNCVEIIQEEIKPTNKKNDGGDK